MVEKTVKKPPKKGGDTGNGFDKRPEDGNSDGRPDAGFTWRDIYIEEVAKNSEKRKGYTKKQSIAAKDVEMAEEGSIAHSKEVKDRMEGRSKESIDHTSGGEKIESIKYILVDPDTK